MKADEELHAELLAAFRQYFEANQRWVNTGTKRSAIELRKIMSDMRRICSKRRVVVREWLDWKEEQLLERNQKRQAGTDDDAN